MFDLIFSIVVLVVSISIFFSYYLDTSSNADIYNLNNNILTLFVETEINSLNGVEIRDLFKKGEITNIHNSVAQQVGEFYFNSKNSSAQNLTKVFISSYINKQMNFQFEIANNSNFTSSLILYNNIKYPESDSKISAVSKKIIVGFINKTSFYLYYLRLKIWV